MTRDSSGTAGPDREAIRRRLRRAIGDRTLTAIADLTDAHPETVRRYVNGPAMPSAEFLIRLCRRLGVNADWLLLGVGPMRAADAAEHYLASVGLPTLFRAVASALERDEPGAPAAAPPAAGLEEEGRRSPTRLGGTPARRGAFGESIIEGKPSLKPPGDGPLRMDDFKHLSVPGVGDPGDEPGQPHPVDLMPDEWFLDDDEDD